MYEMFLKFPFEGNVTEDLIQSRGARKGVEEA